MHSLEFSPNEQFVEIMPSLWYREYVIPKVNNLCYWLYKNCKEFPDEEVFEEQRDKLYIDDKFSKNILYFYDELGTIYSTQTYIRPVENKKYNFALKDEKIKLYSKALNEDREIILEYPKDYDKTKNYKLLILTDGICWKYTMNLGCQLVGLSNELHIQNYIICYILQKDRNIELPMNKQFCEFICIDLINYLADKLKCSLSKDDLVFCGQSFGGLTALYIEKYFPNIFGAIICQSASLWYDKENEIIEYFKNNKILSKLYYSYGNCEKTFISEKGKLFKEILANDPNCNFNIYPGGHDYLSWQDDILNALKFLN